jgi:hypothetical protein
MEGSIAPLKYPYCKTQKSDLRGIEKLIGFSRMDFDEAFAACIRADDTDGLVSLGVTDVIVNDLLLCNPPIPVLPSGLSPPLVRRPSPLIYAILCNSPAAVKYLADLGANLSVQASNNQWRPIHYAVAVRSPAICEFLLSRLRDDKDALTDYGASPLHIAVTAGDGETIGLLLNASANVKIANLNGQTPLHISVVHSDPTVAELLLSFGADIETKNRSGQTAEALARARGNEKVANFLAEVRANPAKVRAREIVLNAARGIGELSVKDRVELLGQRVAVVERLAINK